MQRPADLEYDGFRGLEIEGEKEGTGIATRAARNTMARLATEGVMAQLHGGTELATGTPVLARPADFQHKRKAPDEL
jgi:hypothetical protein